MPTEYDKVLDGMDVEVRSEPNTTPKDRSIVKYMDKMFDEAQRSRAHKVPRWRRNEELYNGDFFKPFKLPKYRSRVVANTIHSTVETMYSILTDRFPKVDIMPFTEEQVQPAQLAQEAVESEMRKHKALRAINGMKRDGLIYGNGFVKMNFTEDGIEYTCPDIYTVFVDPLATNLNNAKCVIFATPTYVRDVRESYENGKHVRAEGKLDEYKSFIRGAGDEQQGQTTTASGGLSGTSSHTGVASSDVRTDMQVLSPLDSTDSGELFGGQVLLKEAWHFIGDELYITTWAGKVLLQHTVAPYDFIPLVGFQNYQDEHHFWGKGEPEIVEPLAVGTAILLSQSLDNIILHGNPGWVMSKTMAKNVNNRPTNKPGQVFYTNGPHERVDRLPAGNISSSNLPLAQYMMQMVDSVSGVHDITQGRNPSGVTAGRAIAQLQEASQQVIRAKEREVGSDSIIDIYKHTLSILANNYEEAIQIRKPTEGGFEFIKIEPYQLEALLDFKYVPGSSMPESKAQRIDQALDYVQLGLLTPEQFWKWHDRDISNEILDEMIEQKKAMEFMKEQDNKIIEGSTNEDEIAEALLRRRVMMGQMEGEDSGKK